MLEAILANLRLLPEIGVQESLSNSKRLPQYFSSGSYTPAFIKVPKCQTTLKPPVTRFKEATSFRHQPWEPSLGSEKSCSSEVLTTRGIRPFWKPELRQRSNGPRKCLIYSARKADALSQQGRAHMDHQRAELSSLPWGICVLRKGPGPSVDICWGLSCLRARVSTCADLPEIGQRSTSSSNHIRGGADVRGFACISA